MSGVKLDELNKTISKQLKESEERSARFVQAFVGSIKGALLSGKDISLAGFGSFSLATADGKPLPAVAKADIENDLAKRLSESNATRIQSMMDGLLEVIKSEILNGRSIELDDIGALELRREKPKIEKQAKGHRLIKPASTTLSFTCPQPIVTPAGQAKPLFSPADGFKKRVEQSRESTILLVMPERDYFTKTLEYYFENAGWDIETMTSVEEAIKRVESGKAYLVIMDAVLPDHQKFAQRLKFRGETSNVPLIALWPNEQAWKVLKEVAIVGDENLAQPFEFRQLLDYADSEIMRAAEEELIFRQQINIHIPTDEQSIEKVIDMVHQLVDLSGITEEGQVALCAAFREAVVNAAQHGNKYRRDKKIEVQYLLDAEKITAVVKDQGQGFDHKMYTSRGASKDAVTAARERHAQGRMGGLGILLMLRCTDHLEYNAAGNQLTLTKHLKGAPKEA
ncbi:MAG: ATP-binding protein [Planctomycetes bacterium]|nr:ATP-binding protein [Planctomycetota bacterium]